MHVTLVARSPAAGGKTYEIAADEVGIGRDPRNEIALDAQSVSRFHARIRADGDGHVIEDLGSKNGTTVNDRAIAAPTELRDGDIIRMGDVVFAFSAPDMATRTITRPAAAAHETVTVLFADLVGHTPLFESLGSEGAYRLISGRVALMQDAVATAGGRVFKTEGDGIIAAFATVGAAVAAAVAIQHAFIGLDDDVPVRIGINSGEAVKHGDDLIGLAVNKAARVMSLAGAGEILLSEVSRALLAPTSGLRINARGWRELKGFTRKERIFEVAWREDAT